MLDPLLPSELPHFFLAYFQQGVGKIPLRFRSIVTQWHHTVAADLSAARLSCNSPVPAHPKGDLLDWDLETVETTGVEQTRSRNRWSEPCDFVHYPAGTSHQEMVHCGHKGMALAPHHYTTSLNHWYRAGWIYAFILFTPNSGPTIWCCSWNQDSSDQQCFIIYCPILVSLSEL